MINTKKFQIFISSTYKDLKSAREKVINTILGLYHFPIGMEMFNADDDEQWNIIEETIRISDYYILIVGDRYGSTTKDGISFTEKEYDFAISQKIPILSFVRDRSFPTKPEERESDPEIINKLNLFIKKVTSSRICDFWSTEEELATKVVSSLFKTMQRHPRIGWIKADNAISSEVSEELAKLIQENRELRSTVEVLSAKDSLNSPNIELDIQIGTQVSLSDSYTKLVAEHFPIDYHYPIQNEDIPSDLIDYVNFEELAKYNATIPSAAEVDRYNYEADIYFKLKAKGRFLIVNISNNGNKKANNVYIDLVFPKEIIAMTHNEVKNLKFPELHLSDNPIHLAKKRKAEAIKRNIPYLSADSLVPYNFGGILSGDYTSNLSNLYHALASSKSDDNHWIKSNNNTITIFEKSLIHTRSININEIIICFISQPKNDIDIIIKTICEEYKSEIEQKIHVNLPHYS